MNHHCSISYNEMADMNYDTDMPIYTPVAGMGHSHPVDVDPFWAVMYQARFGSPPPKPKLYIPFKESAAEQDAAQAALDESPFARSFGLLDCLSEDLILSILVRTPRDLHCTLTATCKRFRFLIRGPRFIASRRMCPTTGFSFLEPMIVLVGTGGHTGSLVRAKALAFIRQEALGNKVRSTKCTLLKRHFCRKILASLTSSCLPLSLSLALFLSLSHAHTLHSIANEKRLVVSQCGGVER
jgi:hypothetical protein